MKAAEILKSITGISCPIFGIQWNPPKYESDTAKQLLVFLEDRRVLFAPEEQEGADYCRQSVENIRSELTKHLSSIDFHSDIARNLRRLRKQCRLFCDKIGAPTFSTEIDTVQKSVLKSELDALRKVAGAIVGALSVAYGLDVEDDLASIIPFTLRN